MKKNNVNPIAFAWDKIGRNGRFAVATVGFIVVTALPFPTTPITLSLAAVAIRNSAYLQKKASFISF